MWRRRSWPFLRRRGRCESCVRGALIYPCLVLTFAFVVLTAMLLFLVPIFTKVYSQLGGQLPMLTKLVVHASNALRSGWYIIFPSFGGTIFGIRRWKRTASATVPGHRGFGAKTSQAF